MQGTLAVLASPSFRTFSASRHVTAIAFILALGQLPGAAQTKKPAAKKKEKIVAAPAPLTWPLPPEQPRVRYVTTYHGANDFKPAKKPSRMLAVLLGGKNDGSDLSDQLVKPYGVAVSAEGRVYIADTASRRVFVFDEETRTVSFLGESGAGRLAKPIGVAVDERGTVYVADASLKRVFGYGPDGRMTMAFGHEGDLSNPSGLAVDGARQRLYVADAARHQILRFSTADGSLIEPIGRRGSEPGEFNFPTNLAVDGQGRMYVADTLNFRVQIFDADGAFVKTFGTLGDSPGTLNRPKGIAVDSERHVYVVDASFNNFQIFDEDGQLLLDVGAGGMGAGEFFLPAGLFIDRRDRIYVADQGNSRIQVFQYVHGGTSE